VRWPHHVRNPVADARWVDIATLDQFVSNHGRGRLVLVIVLGQTAGQNQFGRVHFILQQQSYLVHHVLCRLLHIAMDNQVQCGVDQFTGKDAIIAPNASNALVVLLTNGLARLILESGVTLLVHQQVVHIDLFEFDLHGIEFLFLQPLVDETFCLFRQGATTLAGNAAKVAHDAVGIAINDLGIVLVTMRLGKVLLHLHKKNENARQWGGSPTICLDLVIMN